MYKEISRLIIYGDMDEDSILSRMADIFRKFDVEDTGKEELTREIYTQIKRIHSDSEERTFAVCTERI